MAEKQYIVETKFTADTEEFKEGVKEVEQGLNNLEGALNEMGNDATSAKIGEATEKLGELKGAAEKAKPAVEAAGKGLGEMAAGATTAGAGALTAGAALSALTGMFLGLIPIVVSAGRAIYKWGKTTLEAIRESLQMSLRVAEANNAIEQSGVAAAAAVTKFKLLADEWKNLTPEDKVKEFDNYKKALKNLGIAVTNINDADRVFINQSDEVINALVARARAAGAEKLIAEAEEKKMLAQIERDKLQNRLDTYQNASDVLGGGGRSAANDFALSATDQKVKQQIRDDITEIDKEISKQDTFINRITETYKKAASGAKLLGEFASGAAEENGEAAKGIIKSAGEVAKATEEAAEGSLEKLREKRAELEGLYSGAPTEQLRVYYQRELDYIDEAIAKLDAYIREKINVSNTPIVTPEIASAMGSNGSWGTIGQFTSRNYTPEIASAMGSNGSWGTIGQFTSRNYTPEIGQILLDNAQAEAAFEQWADGISDSLSSSLQSGLTSAMSDGIQALSDAVMGIGDIDASQVVAAFLQPFAQMAVSMGETLIASGIGAISLKKLLSNPWTAIAAGTALVALGSIASSAIQKSINTATGSGGTGGGNTWTGGGQLAAATNTPLQIEVYGTLSGQDIVLAGNNYTNNQRR